jgi:isoquinoline 1-oxidoreductase subunit beta
MNRRSFLKTGAAAAGGLLIKFHLPASAAANAPLKLNAWVHVAPDDAVTLFIHKAEMGQGTVTSLSMLLAEELECDWSKIRTEFPGVDREYGPNQGVVGSQSIRSSYQPLRRAGAVAREMLVQAAAEKWSVDRAKCRAENGAVTNTATGARLTYGALAEDASKVTPPANVTLKDPAQFSIIGKSRKRLDTREKTNGRATFGIDVRLPGMLYAVVERCPVFGGKVKNYMVANTMTVPGVKYVLGISSGVAVVADNTWSANQGRKALKIEWDEGEHANLNSDDIRRDFMAQAEKPGAVARKDGDAPAALAAAAKKIEAVYEVPYLAHAPMEPLNCTADVRADSCEVWASTQGQTAAMQAALGITKLKQEAIQVHTLYMGGGFGRRARNDYVAEAIEISKGVKAPVQLTWMREDDMQQDW